ncbi:hypothetical protein EDB83DRAFT_2204861, partial [Lactarius deliciosus]
PRRDFLASLIRTSKPASDEWWPTRTWTKLTGRPTQKSGRCKRALDETVEWKLWV